MPYFAPLWTSLDHLRITPCTCCIHYNNISLLYFICNDFSHFYYLLSQLFWFFKCYFLFYIYILWFYILLSLRCFGSTLLYMAVFFPLFFRSFDVETSWFATITFPVSAYIASLCARTSMLVDLQHQYIVFLKQFLKGGFYTGKIWALPTAEITCSSKRRFLHSRKGKFLFYSLPCFYAHYPNSSAGVFRCLCKERLLHRKNQL